MAGERRRYLRILFEETIQVEAADWTDPMATGLDISLNGIRFHCEHSLTEGAKVEIVFRSDLKMEGEVRWCWPIEWYYQTAVEFLEISPDEQARLKSYISETTGELYPDYSEEEAERETEESHLEEEDDLLMEEDESSPEEHSFTGTLTPLVFAEKRVMIVDDDSDRVETLTQYFMKRNHFVIEHADKKSHLWDLMDAHPPDLILLSWTFEGEDGIAMLEGIEERFPDIPIVFLAGNVGLVERLEGLNAGAMDFITRPVSLSSIAQSILRIFASMESYPEDDLGLGDEDSFGVDDENDLEFSDDFLDGDIER